MCPTRRISCYRIPSIVQTASGTLVAFAEARESTGDGSVHSIAVRRSSTGGATWGNVTFVKGAPQNTHTRKPAPPPAALQRTGTIIVQL